MSGRDPEAAARVGAWSDLTLALGKAIAAGEAVREADRLTGLEQVDGAAVQRLTLEALDHLAAFDREIQRLSAAPGPAELIFEALVRARFPQ